MPPRQNGTRGQALTCECGFFTSHADYMLVHLKEQAGCKWSDVQRAVVQMRLRQIDLDLRVARETILLAEVEQGLLHKIFQHKPEARRAKARNCHMCGKLTTDKLGERTECARHRRDDGTRGTDGRTMTQILEDVFYGKD